MSKRKNCLNKKEVLRFIAGQRIAAKIIEREQERTLPQLTESESREEYSSLCALWNHSPKTKDMNALANERIRELAERQYRLALVSTQSKR